MKGQNVLIIGGSGFIGSHLADDLLNIKVKKLIIIDNLSVGKKENIKKIIHQVTFIKKNAENFNLLKKTIKKYNINTIFNLATIDLPFLFNFQEKL